MTALVFAMLGVEDGTSVMNSRNPDDYYSISLLKRRCVTRMGAKSLSLFVRVKENESLTRRSRFATKGSFIDKSDLGITNVMEWEA